PGTLLPCRLQFPAWLADALLAWSGQPLGRACGLLPQGLPGPLHPAGPPTGPGAHCPRPAARWLSHAHRSRHLDEQARHQWDRSALTVHRPAQPRPVRALPKGGYLTRTDHGTWMSRGVINATGSCRRPFVPFIPGAAQFTGKRLHTTDYRSSDQFCRDRVLVVGGGNSGAQIAADLLTTASAVTWATRRPPRFLPDEIDGRALFQLATRHVQDTDDTENPGGIAALGDIVATPPIRQARDAGLLTPTPMFCGFTSTGVQWSTGDQVALDAVIWCTGFRPDL